jgi:hypothetical protein
MTSGDWLKPSTVSDVEGLLADLRCAVQDVGEAARIAEAALLVAAKDAMGRTCKFGGPYASEADLISAWKQEANDER